ncbi:MAG: hypothetical protein HUJ52_00445 [Malacoplasma sp.]|nr:hypothetical protein [Malacoplasma sp.]
MKRNSKKLVKILSPLACLTAGSVPLCITLTSCSATSQAGLKCLDLSQNVEIPTSLTADAFKDDNSNIINFLNGDINYHNGNYCIILGSNVSQESNLWFCGSGVTPGQGNHFCNYTRDNAFIGSPFTDAYKDTQSTNKNIDCEMLTFFDVQTEDTAVKFPFFNEIYYSFDYKWTDSDQSKCDKWNEDNETNYHVVKDEYARNDASAVNMRSLINLCEILFGDSFKEITSSKLPYVMTWKKGVPQKTGFSQLQGKTINDFHDKVISIWEEKDEEEEKK